MSEPGTRTGAPLESKRRAHSPPFNPAPQGTETAARHSSSLLTSLLRRGRLNPPTVGNASVGRAQGCLGVRGGMGLG